MKAITIWQPWASLLAIGAKQYETRSWETKYRGTIAIHAAKKKPPQQGDLKSDVFSDMMNAFAKHYGACRFDWHLGGTRMNSNGSDNGFDIPLGCIIATAELVECWKIIDNGHTNGSPLAARIEGGRYGGKTNIVEGKEILFGDWAPGRYAWEFKNMMLLPKPIPAKGKQGLWTWDEMPEI